MDVFTYHTINSATEGIFREKGSKFLAFAWPVKDEEDIKNRIDGITKEYFDARHHCYAWMLGPEKTHFRAFDDGEPNHSAGDPILNQIRSFGITDVLVVVVRYFGGVKLGVGGLVAAYRSAAGDALTKATVVEVEVVFEMRLAFPYESTPAIMKLVKEFDLKVLKQDFSISCKLDLRASLRKKKNIMEKFDLLKATGTDFVLRLDV